MWTGTGTLQQDNLMRRELGIGPLQYDFNKTWYANFKANRIGGLISGGKMKNIVNKHYKPSTIVIEEKNYSGLLDIKRYVQANFDNKKVKCLTDKIVDAIKDLFDPDWYAKYGNKVIKEVDRLVESVGDELGRMYDSGVKFVTDGLSSVGGHISSGVKSAGSKAKNEAKRLGRKLGF